MDQLPEVKMYSDYKSPYAWLAFDPGFDLQKKFNVRVRWIPFQLRIKGSGQRSVYSEYKVKYSYMDARRSANARGGLIIKGPLKIYDTTAALIAGLYADKHGRLLDYSRAVYEKFFRRELAIDEVEAMADFLDGFGLSGDEYKAYFSGDGQADYQRALDEAVTDRVFGVPMFLFEDEQFWGHDRLPVLEQRLAERGLSRAADDGVSTPKQLQSAT